jgi:hypothetical protein
MHRLAHLVRLALPAAAAVGLAPGGTALAAGGTAFTAAATPSPWSVQAGLAAAIGADAASASDAVAVFVLVACALCVTLGHQLASTRQALRRVRRLRSEAPASAARV